MPLESRRAFLAQVAAQRSEAAAGELKTGLLALFKARREQEGKA